MENGKHRPSYTICQNVDAALAQLQRLVTNGYFFYFHNRLSKRWDPESLDRKLIEKWGLDQPGWKREKRRRGHAPAIWYLRYDRSYLLTATHGKGRDGQPHEFFRYYGDNILDIRRHPVQFRGYAIHYPISANSGQRRLTVRLNAQRYDELRSRLTKMAIQDRYRQPELLEAECSRLPYQWYWGVQQQVRGIVKQVNRRRRYAGFEPLRLSCVPRRARIA